MIAFALALATVTVAYPRPGMTLPAVSRSYMIGATDSGATNVMVQGRSVPVYRTGAWAAMVDVAAGTNSVEIIDGAFATNVVLKVEKPRPPQPESATAKPAKPKEYTKLEYAGDEPVPHPKGRAPAEITIVIDPGHGGTKDRGIISPHGVDEKIVNLKMAFALKAALEKRGYRVLMTRETDEPIQLLDRAKTAHQLKADAFISIHHNAPPIDRPADGARYAAVYSWCEPGASLAKAIAARFGARNEHANFAVTRSPEIPSVLIEIDFITHPAGEEAVENPAVRKVRAEKIADGFEDWCKGSADLL